MPIHITKTPNVHISRSDYLRLREQFSREFSMYAGPRPDFEEWAIEQLQLERDQKRVWPETTRS